MHGDTKRLADDEFLNDTLIEFGMKRIFVGLKETEEANPSGPPLASQVHMFNSFFYKRLSQRKLTLDSNGV
jgi:Ulp1 family protease